jgi:hypothetical protein
MSIHCLEQKDDGIRSSQLTQVEWHNPNEKPTQDGSAPHGRNDHEQMV